MALLNFLEPQKREVLIALQLGFLHVIKTVITKLFGTREHLFGAKDITHHLR